MRSKAEKRHTNVILILSTLFFVSLIYSVYVLSISLFLFGLVAMLQIDDKSMRYQIRKDFIPQVEDLLGKPEWWVVSLSFFIVLYGGLYSDDTAYWLSRLRIKAPFLLLPLAFFLIPAISRADYLRIHGLFAIVVTLSTLPVSWVMIGQYDQVLKAISHGQSIDTPISHIRYSLLVAMAVVSSLYLAYSQEFGKRQSFWLKVAGIYLILFLHVLAVRSGLVALYVVAIYFLIVYLRQVRKPAHTFAFLISICALPVLAYLTIPSFKEKLAYTYEDVTRYQRQEWNAYSDAERILSVRAGLDIAQESPWIGVGVGDLRNRMRDYFYEYFDKDTFIMPHNQFVSVFAGSGLIGTVLFIFSLLVPFLIGWTHRNFLFIALNLIILVSLMVENTFETSIGVAFYLFFTLLGLNHMKPMRTKILP